jgi:hypothetical protein
LLVGRRRARLRFDARERAQGLEVAQRFLAQAPLADASRLRDAEVALTREATRK